MSPALVIREAFAADMIDDPDVWMEAMDARNETSHLYDAKRATAIVEQIAVSFLPAFERYVERLMSEAS